MLFLITLACTALSRPNGAAAPLDTAAPATPSGAVLFMGGVVVGLGPAEVLIEDGRVTGIGSNLSSDATVIDVHGRFLAPAFIDSHVHLAYLPAADALADGGIAGAVDLAAPLSFLATEHAPLEVRASGPMVTAVGGYPTRSWGSDGYGIECADGSAASAAVDQLKAAGALLIKLPVTSSPQLDDDALLAAVTRAHALSLPVVSHALSDDEAARAAAAGVDVLAHTPTGALSADTIDAWRGRTVISTLGAFGGGATTLANLAALHEAGVTVLYGTDFGNTRAMGIDPDELLLLQSAGLTPAEILASGTSVPAAFWGFDDLGSLAVGKSASLLVLPGNPLLTPEVLTTPEQVWIGGVRRR